MPLAFEFQPRIQGRLIRLEPLQAHDFEALYAVAADPLIWQQHPNKDRYRRDVFSNYFEGALASGGAFCVIDETGQLIGSSRFYDFDAAQSVVCIGYTFLARSAWGRRYNRELKTLMLDHAFAYVDRVLFHVGAGNLRSRKAMEKLGAVQIGEAAVSYYGEPSSNNVIYEIDKTDWALLRQQ